MGLQIHELKQGKYSAWDAFVENSPEATFFHRTGWKTVLERAFKHPTFFFYAERNGEIEGILPLAQIKSLFFGNTLISIPFCAYGGIVSTNSEATAALNKSARDLAERLDVDALELRNRQQSALSWPTKSLYVTFSKEIDPDPEINLQEIPRKQRAMVRKGIKAGLQSEDDIGWLRLYKIYAESVRNLGTPVFPAKYFRILREVFGPDCKVLMITHEGRDIAGVMSFYFRSEVLPYYSGSNSLARNLKGNDFMYWELMRQSAQQGIDIFDYGRSKEGTGSYSFKKNWGFVPKPLYYEYYLVKSDSIPEVNPMNPKYQRFINAWKKMPLTVTNFIGPFLAKNLG